MSASSASGRRNPSTPSWAIRVLRANPRFKALQEGFDAFHAAYRKGSWDQAAALLTQCAKLPGANPRLVTLYERRLDFLKSRTPGRDWDGVLRLPVE